jgi:CheY-like chemotaxis protein
MMHVLFHGRDRRATIPSPPLLPPGLTRAGVKTPAVMAWNSCRNPGTAMANGLNSPCVACGKLVRRDQGVASRDRGIFDLQCFLDGTPEKKTPEVSVPPNQTLLGVHVFIVEDNDSSLELLRTAMEYSGAFVSTARDAAEGKAMLREIRPHVLVSDIAMPHDGLEMVREVIRFAADTGLIIPAVAISAGSDGRESQLLEAGFAAFIPKPLDPFVLAGVVAKLARESAKK